MLLHKSDFLRVFEDEFVPLLSVWILPMAALSIAAVLCWRFLRPDSVFHVLDMPVHRSLHVTPVPRSGGVAIVLSVLCCVALAWSIGWLPVEGAVVWWGGAALLLAVTGMVDDRWGLSAGLRLLIQLLAALLLLTSGWTLQKLHLPGLELALPDPLAWLSSILFLLWMINLYNFMDGMDGFSGGMAVIGFLAYAWLGWQAGDLSFTLLALIIAGASLGFLLFNFPPARIFMGDAGAPVLGLMAAALALWAEAEDLFPLWVSLLIFSVFIVDATFTLLRRLLRGEKIWQAHRQHVYQRVVLRGWSHTRTVLWSYVLMLGSALSAVFAANSQPVWQWLVLGIWGMLYAVLIGRFGGAVE